MKSDSKESKKKLARRSQSLSPSRLKTDEVDIEKLEIKEDLCLSDLQRIKAKIMGQMGLNEKLEPVKDEEDVEDGELLSEDDTPDAGERTKKIKDLRQKLSQDSAAVVSSTSESPIERRIPNISQEIKASLGDYSAEDIENKLIPFKKRQFNELQFEEIKLKKQIEKAKSQTNTPRRLSDSSDQLRSPPELMIASSPPEPELDDKRVSPLKLSLRGVVIQQPSSSSSSAEVMAERVTVTDHSESHLKQDDNAMFPEQRVMAEQVHRR